MKNGIFLASLCMITAVAASNYLVEIPINNFLTWGALIYPTTFLVTELTNYFYGPKQAKRVVYIGFVCAVAISMVFMNFQIALASGLAFLIGQLLDITVFTKLRRRNWWLAPLSASVAGSFVDTLIFFTIAFWGQGWLMFTLGIGNFFVKILVDAAMLVPFRFYLWRTPRAVAL